MKLSQYQREWLRRSAAFERGARMAAMSAAHHTITTIKTQIIPGTDPYPPVDRGHYRAGWHARSTETGAIIQHANPKMAAIIEHGVRAGAKFGAIAIAAVTEWVRRKGLARPTAHLKDVGGIGFRPVLASAPPNEERRMAIAILRKRQREGWPGRKVIERVKPYARRYYAEEMVKVIHRVLRGGI